MLLTMEDYRSRARKVLPRFVFEFVDGGAEHESCLQANRDDFERIRLTPRVLRDTREVDASVEVYGSTWRQPFALAPTGLNGVVRPGGDGMLARAAAEMGVPFVLSTASNQRAEEVRAIAGGGEQWLQLYVMQDRRLAEQLVRRARTAGYRALVLTADVPVGGRRWRDVRNGFSMPFRVTPRIAWDVARRPGWALRMLSGGSPRFVNLAEQPGESLSMEVQASLLARSMDRSLTWDSLRWLRSLWGGPLLLKGVLHREDAVLAARHGVDGLIVSNHGGRQLDAAPSSISVLPGIVDAVAGRIPVFLDSGVRSGADIVRAQALGARAVFIGRPALYGLACGGARGVADVMRLLAEDYERTMILSGSASARQARASWEPAGQPVQSIG
ncbi:alpha-hydroxy-acid oxidizing protein [Achromobacter pestifer]|uniref:Alpha-hydroxy-acid oxidizing protein n=1 Tax=Achromobacter pestifer TaxID=1353889 RepID=A0A7D4E4M6_9BURK|nr:alpha-hydroxy acid oxidase [Achromobacter pestifer]QKH38394.1 alpha-hydroxy-acid oxidizing protein [Achromobacter pestifer]